MQTILYVLIAAILGLLFCFLAIKEHKERIQAEKELKEARKHAQDMAKANETKANANTGNIDNDNNYMGNVLHQLHQQAGKK